MAELIAAPNLQTAQTLLEQENFDLVILDLKLPDGIGWDILPHLQRRHQPPIPVVVFSAYEVESAALHQVTAALVKSRTSNQQLLETIKNLIDFPGLTPVSES